MLYLSEIPKNSTLLDTFTLILREYGLDVVEVAYADDEKHCSWNDFAATAQQIMNSYFTGDWFYDSTCDMSITLVGENWQSILHIDYDNWCHNALYIQYDYEWDQPYSVPDVADFLGT